MTTRLLNDTIADQVREMLAELKLPVEILFFGSEIACDYCEDTRQLLEEVVQLSDKLTLVVYDVDADKAIAEQYHVDKTPGIVITAKNGDERVDYGIRFAGIPSGSEFSSLIHDFILVSGRDSGLSPKTRQALKQLKKPIHLMVFVTPT